MDNKNKSIKFPHNFKFEKTFYGFKVKATGGEIFPNKYIFSFIIPTLVILFIAWGVTLYFLGTKYASIIDSSKELTIYTGIFVAFPLSFPAIFYFLLNLTNTKAEYFFSPGGIVINSKKDSMFISKKNITKIYTKKRISGSSDSLNIWYCLMIEFKEPIKVFGVNGKIKKIDAISLFNDYRFKKIEIANYLLQEINNTIDFRNNKIENLKINNEPVEEVELSKELNYQEINYGFKIKYRADDFFSNNIFGVSNNEYILLICIFLSFIGIITLKSIESKFNSILKFICLYFSDLDPIKIIFVILFLAIIISFVIKIPFELKAEYLFSPAGINISSMQGSFFAPHNDIKDIYMEKEVLSSSEDETVIYYKLTLEFNKEIYFKYLNKNKTKANLFSTKDKKVALYLLQKIKEALNLA